MSPAAADHALCGQGARADHETRRLFSARPPTFQTLSHELVSATRLKLRHFDHKPTLSFEGLELGHNRQGQIVAGAAGVARLEVVAVAGKDRAVGEVTEGARNRADAEVLLITVKTVPAVNVPVPVSTKVNGTPLLMVTPRAVTFDRDGVGRFNTHL